MRNQNQFAIILLKMIRSMKYFFSFMKTPGTIYDQKGQIFKFANIDGLALNKLLLVENQHPALILAVMERSSLGMLLSHQRDINNLSVKLTEEKLGFDQKQIIKLDDINILGEIKLSPLPKRQKQRMAPKSQIYTGDFWVDLFKPIAYGQLLKLSTRNYIQRLGSNFDKVVVCTRQIGSLSQMENFIFFQIDNSTASSFYIPQVALNYAVDLSQNQSVLLVFTDLEEHSRSYNHIQEQIHENIYSNQSLRVKQILNPPIIGQMSQACGYRQNSNLTVCVVDNDSFDEYQEKLRLELDSLTSQRLDEKEIKSPPSPFNLVYQSPISHMVAQNFYHIMNEYETQKTQYLEKQKLKIHIEPWDYYVYLDGSVWINMIKEFNTIIHDQIDTVILAWWICKLVEEDKAGLLKNEPKKLVKSMITLAENLKEFQDMSFKQFFSAHQKEMQDSKDFALFIGPHMERFLELHMLHLQMDDMLLPFKNDHIYE